MNGFEKTVKYFAFFLAGIIIVSVLCSVIFGFSFLAHLFDGKGSSGVKDYHEIFEGIQKIEIDVGASDIEIVQGETFLVDGYDLSDNFKVRKNLETLKIEEKKFSFWNSTVGKIVLTVPQNYSLSKLSISSGAGKVYVDGISSDIFDLEQGAGVVHILNSDFRDVSIEGGAGKVEITDSVLNDLDLSSGAGAVDIRASITGNSEIECGIGKVSLNVLEKKENYSIWLEKGLGSITVDGESYSSSSSLGSGVHRLKVEGGIGSIQIHFEK